MLLGYERNLPVKDSQTGEISHESYAITPPDSILNDLFKNYEKTNTNPRCHRMVYDYFTGGLLKEHLLSDFAEHMTFESQFDDDYRTYVEFDGKTRLKEIMGMERDDEGNLIFENDLEVIDEEKEIYDLPPIYKKPGRNRKDQGRLRWIIKKNTNVDQIYQSIYDVYNVRIRSKEE